MADRSHSNGGITVIWRMDIITDLPIAIEIQNTSKDSIAIFTLSGQAMKIRPGLTQITTIDLSARNLWSWEDQAHYGNINEMRRVLVGPSWSLTRSRM